MTMLRRFETCGTWFIGAWVAEATTPGAGEPGVGWSGGGVVIEQIGSSFAGAVEGLLFAPGFYFGVVTA